MSSSFDFSKTKIPAKVQQDQSSKKAALPELEYDDKRGESVSQLKLQEKANQSNNVGQFSELENLANDSQQVTQLMDLQETTNKNPQQYEPIQKKKGVKEGINENPITEAKKIKYKANDWKKINKLAKKKDVMIQSAFGDEFKWEEGSAHGVFASESDGREIELTHDDIDILVVY